MLSIQSELNDIFGDAIASAFPDIPDAPVVIALSGNNPKFGDYQCNSAMPIVGILKAQGLGFFFANTTLLEIKKNI